MTRACCLDAPAALHADVDTQHRSMFAAKQPACWQGLSTALAVRDSLALRRVGGLLSGMDGGYTPGWATAVRGQMQPVARMQHVLFLQSLLRQLPQLIPQASRLLLLLLLLLHLPSCLVTMWRPAHPICSMVDGRPLCLCSITGRVDQLLQGHCLRDLGAPACCPWSLGPPAQVLTPE